MTSQSPRIYVYKITFEEVPYYYYGVHKEKRYNEYYMGSPVTNKWCWELYTPKKQILEVFDYTDEGWLEAQKIEDRLIKPFYNTDKWCLNESCGGITSLKVLRESGKKTGNKAKELGVGIFGLTSEQRSENGKKGGKISGKRNKENKIGICGLTPEQRSENAIKGGNKAKELDIGVCGRTKEQMTEDGKKGGKIGGKIGGKRTKELGVGIFGLTSEQRSENGKKAGKIGGKKIKELGIGIHGRTKEQMSEDGRKAGKIGSKITNSQKWMCLETGYVSTSAGLSAYQKSRGIDTSKRKRIL